MASVQTRCSWMMVVLFWDYCCPFISAIAETARLPLGNDAHCRQHSYTIPMLPPPSYLSTAFNIDFCLLRFLAVGFYFILHFREISQMLIHKPHCKQKEQGENRMNILVSPEFRIRTVSVLCTIYCCRVSECNVVSSLRLNKMLTLICLPLLHIYVRGNEWRLERG